MEYGFHHTWSLLPGADESLVQDIKRHQVGEGWYKQHWVRWSSVLTWYKTPSVDTSFTLKTGGSECSRYLFQLLFSHPRRPVHLHAKSRSSSLISTVNIEQALRAEFGDINQVTMSCLVAEWPAELIEIFSGSWSQVPIGKETALTAGDTGRKCSKHESYGVLEGIQRIVVRAPGEL